MLCVVMLGEDMAGMSFCVVLWHVMFCHGTLAVGVVVL